MDRFFVAAPVERPNTSPAVCWEVRACDHVLAQPGRHRTTPSSVTADFIISARDGVEHVCYALNHRKNEGKHMTRLSLGQAIRSALDQQYLTTAALAVPALLSGASLAQAQTADNSAADQKSQSLETIVVTGSNIRRVDIETANPVVTIDRAAIQQSGRLTLGDLVQDLPAVTGPVTNPRVNNGGGTGASTISLR